MSDKDKKQLEFEIRHIFESGENELRIYDMVVNFIEKRYENPLDKSIEQRAEEIYPHDAGVNLTIPREAWIEGYKACQQSLEVSEQKIGILNGDEELFFSKAEKDNVKAYIQGHTDAQKSIGSERLYTKEEMMSFAIFTHSFAEVNLEGVFEIFESLPKANS